MILLILIRIPHTIWTELKNILILARFSLKETIRSAYQPISEFTVKFEKAGDLQLPMYFSSMDDWHRGCEVAIQVDLCLFDGAAIGVC